MRAYRPMGLVEFIKKTGARQLVRGTRKSIRKKVALTSFLKSYETFVKSYVFGPESLEKLAKSLF